MRPTRFQNSGFTLIELVVVIVIIAILAAVAVPKFNNRTTSAREAANLQSLSTLRGATELYNADTGNYPSVLPGDLQTYLKGPFPSVSIGSSTNSSVKMVTSDPIGGSDIDGSTGWIYNATTGELRINHTSLYDR